MTYIKAFEAWIVEENTRLARDRRFDLVIELRRGLDGRYASERTRQFWSCWIAAQQRQRSDPIGRREIKDLVGTRAP